MRLYEEIVGRGGVSPAYFFDSMSLGECAAFLRGMHRREQDAWERTRMLMYTMCQVNSTKELEPTDVLRFPWDEDAPMEDAASEEDIEALRKKAKELEQFINGKEE